MSIVEQLKNNTSSGQISVLSKAISTECLCFFKNDSCFDNVKQWNLVFQNTPDYDNVDFGIDLLGGDQSINAAFMLNYNIKQSIEFLKKKSVSVKCLEADIHCSANLFLYKPDEMSTKKAYAFRSDLPLSGDVICSDSQEKDDYELPVMTWNVEKEEKQYASDVSRYQRAFDEIWDAHSVETIPNNQGGLLILKEVLVEKLKDMQRLYTPEEIYDQILINNYKEQLKNCLDPDDLVFFRDTAICKHLRDYQKIALSHLIHKMEVFGGALLGDAVGLGKTWTALGVVKFYLLQGYKVFIVAPHSVKNDWEQYRANNDSELEADNLQFDLIPHTDLGRQRFEDNNELVMERIRNANNRCLFVIDEAHNFRNNTIRTKTLLGYLKQSRLSTKVLLLTATPVNLGMKDLKKEINLIACGNLNAFEKSLGLKNFETVIDLAARNAQNARKDNPDISIDEINNVLPEQFKQLMSSLIVARTRQQLIDAGITLNCPRANPSTTIKCNQLDQSATLTPDGKPIPLEVFIDSYLPKHMTAYSPKIYYVPLQQNFDNENLRSVHLRGMLQNMILKRLESSWICCKKSIDRMAANFRQLKNALDNANFKIELDSQVRDDLEEINDAEGNGVGDLDFETDLPGTITQDDLNKIVEAGHKDVFYEDLDDDLRAFDALKALFSTFSPEHDSKLDSLVKAIRNRFDHPIAANHNRRRILVFTTYEETASYLCEELQKKFDKVAMVSGSTLARDRKMILDRFAPYTRLFRNGHYTTACPALKAKEKELSGEDLLNWSISNEAFDEWRIWMLGKREEPYFQKAVEALENPIEILIATDCLSEGTNLQDADLVIDYDIHWNPVRLLQRLGRINRVESPNAIVDAINFYPENDMEQELGLIARINKRIVDSIFAQAEINHQAVSQEMREQLEVFSQGNNDEVVAQIQCEMTSVMTNWDLGNTLPNGEIGYQSFPQEQTFIDALRARRKLQDNWRQKLPNGIFSGVCCKAPEDREYVFFLKDKGTNQYKLIHLDASGLCISDDWNTNVSLLKSLSKEPRKVSQALDEVNVQYLQEIADNLNNYLSKGESKQTEENNFWGAMLNGQANIPQTQSTDYVLVCWMELN